MILTQKNESIRKDLYAMNFDALPSNGQLKYIINGELIDVEKNKRILGEFKFVFIPNRIYGIKETITYRVYLKNYSVASGPHNYWIVICKNNCRCENDPGNCNSCAKGYGFYNSYANCTNGSDICPNRYYTKNDNFLNCMRENDTECPMDYPIYNEYTRECRKNLTEINIDEFYNESEINTIIDKYMNKINNTESSSNEKLEESQSEHNNPINISSNELSSDSPREPEIDSTYSLIEINEDKINTTKENLINEISSILNDTEKGKIYKKNGGDYSILIYPTNSLDSISTSHVNFTECEKVLRSHYRMPNTSIITFMQIELDNNNSQSLINQIEYQAYSENKTKLDLSLCKDVNIQVVYSIKNNSKNNINIDSINTFKESGVDIFNISDSFFNDICEPYSESDNDLILEDRIKYIYQNYSLCEDGCTYDKIDLENMTIVCDCKVKDNITTVISPIKLEHAEGSSTNFDVIKCANLVFSFDGKNKNIGFWFLGFLVLAYLPILIYYFYIGIKPVREYIIKQMKDYGYIINNQEKNNNEGLNNNSNNNDINFENQSEKKIKKVKRRKSKNNSPPKKVKTLNYNKENDKIFIQNVKIIDNSSSINIIKSSNRGIDPGININLNNNNENKNTRSIKYENKSKEKSENITVLPTQDIPETSNEKGNKNNLNTFTLINMDLNLSRNKDYIPPDSNIILNNYTFEEAVKYDKRETCTIFYIFILAKQIVFHTFLYHSPIEIFPLRLCLFIFTISSDLALNALFYFNDNISKKYRNSKNLFLFSLSDNVAVVFLSTFVGFVLLTLLGKLSNSTNAIRGVFAKEEEKIKKDKEYIVTKQRKIEILAEIDDILKKYKIKMIILISVEFVLVIFFWYFVTAFCHVYEATQTSWLIDCFLSMLYRAFIEIAISFGLTKLYRVALTGDIHCLYKIIMFLYNLG